MRIKYFIGAFNLCEKSNCHGKLYSRIKSNRIDSRIVVIDGHDITSCRIVSTKNNQTLCGNTDFKINRIIESRNGLPQCKDVAYRIVSYHRVVSTENVCTHTELFCRVRVRVKNQVFQL